MNSFLLATMFTSHSISTFTYLLFLFISNALGQIPAIPGVQAAVDQVLTADIIVLGVFLIICGLGFCFFGAKLFRLCLFVAGGYLLALFAISLVGRFEPVGGYSNPKLVVGITAVVAGLVGGFLSLYFYKLGCFGIGALGGYTLALFLLSLKSGGLITGQWPQFAFIIAFAIVGGIAALVVERHAIRIATSVGGAYLTILGIDVFAKFGFAAAARQIISNPSSPFVATPQMYGLAAGFVVLALAGIYIQYKVTSRKYSGSRGLIK